MLRSTLFSFQREPEIVAACFSRHGLGEGFDLVDFIFSEMHFASAHGSLYLPRIAGSDDSAGHGGMAQRPGNCDFADRTLVAVGYLSHAPDQCQIVREIWFGKVGMPPAPVVRGQLSRALASHGAGQETGSHRGINDDPNAFTQAVGQNLVFDLAMHQRIPWLQRSHWSDGLGTLQLLDIEVGDSNPAYLAFALQVGERGPSFFQCG